ncbi:MAG: hypothetical protein AAGC65_10155 [Mucilaginibacter sp.]|uniref:hypothetical protein n=1 Tax=Mucilaginibacter sp. TaxID=1882438 RepID=UPI0031AED7EA
MKRAFQTIANFIWPKRKKTNIAEWFTKTETLQLIGQINQVLELSNISIGDTEDQMLLMDLFRDTLNEGKYKPVKKRRPRKWNYQSVLTSVRLTSTARFFHF